MTLLRLIFGCAHRDQTRVFTINQETYKRCTACGAKLPYSWAEMRPLTRAERRAA